MGSFVFVKALALIYFVCGVSTLCTVSALFLNIFCVWCEYCVHSQCSVLNIFCVWCEYSVNSQCSVPYYILCVV